MFFKKLISHLFFYLLICETNLAYQPEIYKDFIYADHIKTVEIFRKGWELSQPIINMNTGDQLEVRFDDMNKNPGNYYYTFVQCNADWTVSDLVDQDYLVGFYENPITNYKFSTNTTVSYIHYSFEFPNQDIRISKSGNYALVVYRDFNKEDIIFTRRFFIYESFVDIIADAKRPMLSKHFETGQEIDIVLNHDGYEIQNPYDEIKLIIIQNMAWDTKNDILKPTYIRNDELVYDYNDENVFKGNSEFRYFDIKSLRYQSEYVRSITYDYQYHHVQLVPGEERHFGKYFFNEDINGKYLVSVQEFPDPEIEADYVMVHFTLPYNVPIVDGELHIYGELTDWHMDARSKMEYNYEKRTYEKSLLLKQGYYNYCYALKEKDIPKPNIAYIEGSHFETENDYFIFVYHRPFHLRYDRLVGIQVVNSVRKNQN